MNWDSDEEGNTEMERNVIGRGRRWREKEGRKEGDCKKRVRED